MSPREQMVRNYIDGYNEYDIDKMMEDFADTIIFENIVDDEITLRMVGVQAFKMQAEQARDYFSSRQQTINRFRETGEVIEVDLDYKATVAVDMPGGPRKGTELAMAGMSVFTFGGEKIIKLTDIS